MSIIESLKQLRESFSKQLKIVDDLILEEERQKVPKILCFKFKDIFVNYECANAECYDRNIININENYSDSLEYAIKYILAESYGGRIEDYTKNPAKEFNPEFNRNIYAICNALCKVCVDQEEKMRVLNIHKTVRDKLSPVLQIINNDFEGLHNAMEDDVKEIFKALEINDLQIPAKLKQLYQLVAMGYDIKNFTFITAEIHQAAKKLFDGPDYEWLRDIE